MGLGMSCFGRRKNKRPFFYVVPLRTDNDIASKKSSVVLKSYRDLISFFVPQDEEKLDETLHTTVSYEDNETIALEFFDTYKPIKTNKPTKSELLIQDDLAIKNDTLTKSTSDLNNEETCDKQLIVIGKAISIHDCKNPENPISYKTHEIETE